MATVMRSDLTEAVHEEVGLSRLEAARFVGAVIEAISERLVAGEVVKISSFGNFTPRHKGPRMGRNPKTGEPALIAARRVVTFQPSRISGSAAGLSEKRYSAAGLKPMWDSDGTSHRVGLIHYRWASTYQALCRLAETEVSPFDDVILEYVNPATGKSLYPTFTCCVQTIRPGVRTRAHRHTSCAVYYVFQGEGHSVVGDRRFDWAEGDLFVVPTWFWHEHGNSNGEPAVLFSIHDFPAMKSLGIYHEMPHLGVRDHLHGQRIVEVDPVGFLLRPGERPRIERLKIGQVARHPGL